MLLDVCSIQVYWSEFKAVVEKTAIRHTFYAYGHINFGVYQ